MSQVQVDLNKCPDVSCECGHPFFVSRIIIKRIPGLMVASTVDQFAPLNIMVCALCNKAHIPQGAMLPPNVAPAGLTIPKHKTAGDS